MRTVIVDASLRHSLEDDESAKGLLITRTGETTDFVVDFIPSPQLPPGEILEEWIAEHAVQVTRCLPGGLSVAGIHGFGNVAVAHAVMLRRPYASSAFIQTYRDAASSRFLCFSLSASPRQRSPAQVRFSPKCRNNLVRIECVVPVDLSIRRDFSDASDRDIFNRCGIKLKADDIELLGNFKALENKMGLRQNARIRTAFCSPPPLCVFTRSFQMTDTRYRMRGSLYCYAYVNDKESILHMKTALLSDIKRTVRSRLRIFGEVCSGVSKFGKVSSLPSRVTFTLLSGVEYSDYIFQDADWEDEVAGIKENCIDVFGVSASALRDVFACTKREGLPKQCLPKPKRNHEEEEDSSLKPTAMNNLIGPLFAILLPLLLAIAYALINR